MAEAYAGLGDDAKAQELMDAAKTLPGVAAWMLQTSAERLAKLKGLLAQTRLGRVAFSAAP